MREQLLDRMIMVYGFEHEAVIAFAQMMEDSTYTDEALAAIVEAHEEAPLGLDEDE